MAEDIDREAWHIGSCVDVNHHRVMKGMKWLHLVWHDSASVTPHANVCTDLSAPTVCHNACCSATSIHFQPKVSSCVAHVQL